MTEITWMLLVVCAILFLAVTLLWRSQHRLEIALVEARSLLAASANTELARELVANKLEIQQLRNNLSYVNTDRSRLRNERRGDT